MTPRTKSILTICGTLLIGIVIGGLLTGAFLNHRAKKIGGALMNEKRFTTMVGNLIKPSPQQSDTVSAVLHKYGSAFAARNRNHQRGQVLLLDSLERAITPLLDSEQQDRLHKRFLRMEEQRRRFFENRDEANE